MDPILPSGKYVISVPTETETYYFGLLQVPDRPDTIGILQIPEGVDPPVFTLKRFDEADGYRYSLLIGGQCVDETDNGSLCLKPEVGDCKKWMIVPSGNKRYILVFPSLIVPNVRNVPKPKVLVQHTRYEWDVGCTGVKLECLSYVQTINRHAALFVELWSVGEVKTTADEQTTLNDGTTGGANATHNKLGRTRSLRTDQVSTSENDTRTCQTTYVPKLPDGLRNGDESPHVSPRGKEIWICLQVTMRHVARDNMDALRASYSNEDAINRQKKLRNASDCGHERTEQRGEDNPLHGRVSGSG
ncbi:hypothetical protein EV363DRAFT_1515506 [Boletus edulis]|nr:hypothetical protein EV363DRAFT_1515506 [Boletus edulis]